VLHSCVYAVGRDNVISCTRHINAVQNNGHKRASGAHSHAQTFPESMRCGKVPSFSAQVDITPLLGCSYMNALNINVGTRK